VSAEILWTAPHLSFINYLASANRSRVIFSNSKFFWLPKVARIVTRDTSVAYTGACNGLCVTVDGRVVNYARGRCIASNIEPRRDDRRKCGQQVRPSMSFVDNTTELLWEILGKSCPSFSHSAGVLFTALYMRAFYMFTLACSNKICRPMYELDWTHRQSFRGTWGLIPQTLDHRQYFFQKESALCTVIYIIISKLITFIIRQVCYS